MGCQFFLQQIFPTRGSTLPRPPIFFCNSAEVLLSTGEKIQTPLRASETWPCLPSPLLPSTPTTPPLSACHPLGISCCPLVAVHLPPLSGLTGLPTTLSNQPPRCPPLYPLSLPRFTQHPRILSCLLSFCLPPLEHKLLEGWDSVPLLLSPGIWKHLVGSRE